MEDAVASPSLSLFAHAMTSPPERNLLDKLRIRPALDWWALEQQGDLFAVAHRWSQAEQAIGDKRGAIKGFSKSSRRRMLKRIARIDWKRHRNSLFLTLTFPDSAGDRDYRLRTQHRHQILRDIENHVGKPISCLWRCEWKPRLSGQRTGQLFPHLHHVIFGAPWIEVQWLAKRWGEIVGSPKYVQVDLALLPTAKAAAVYASKYAAKDSLSGLDKDAYLNIAVGRCWGLHRRELVPERPQREVPWLPPEAVVMAQDFAAQLTGSRPAGGFCLLHESAERLFGKLVDSFQLNA